jgi:ATP-dependent DNA ligase
MKNKRSRFLLKYKPENSDEGVIVKLIEGSGKLG